MKLKFITLGILFSLSFSGFIMSSAEYEDFIQMPDEQTLRNHLNQNDFAHFVEKTNLIKKLADKKLSPETIVREVELSFYDYDEMLKQAMSDTVRKIMMDEANRTMKPKLYEELLKDNPTALNQLEQLDLYKNSKK